MSGLLSLPAELLNTILEQLDQSSWASLARTSRRSHSTASRFLYRDITLRNVGAKSLSSTFKKHPTLAERVQSLTIHHNISDPPEPLDAVITAVRGLQRLTVKGSQELFEKAIIGAPGDSDDWFPLLPTAEFLQIVDESDIPSALSNLHTCELNLFDSDAWILCPSDWLFTHPNLRVLSLLGARLHSGQPIPGADELPPRPPHPTPLQELTLLSCDLHGFDLIQVLSRPRALQKLTFKGRPLLELRYCTDCRDTWALAIQQQSHSLRALDIYFSNSVWQFNPPLRLASMTALEELVISPAVLQGNRENDPLPLENHLPPSLVKLTLRVHARYQYGTHKRTYLAKLHEWVEAGALPNLRHIGFEDFAAPFLEQDAAAHFGGRVTFSEEQVPRTFRFPIDCACCEYSW